ncbi:MAG TPA: prenyltransferase/squalene oxidase repeat-containing protein [Solirubrobacterales bacterium]|nr:prenyltransferase/squalene oxidase repeat-containing protein [Solirubrobacterales bacterium]
MSWEAVSFLILALGLLAGFAWYERSRPPSQVVALVAALAALAIAGRIAFAAFPNVKPTTDIVVFAGYALGGAPGFAVGALSALVSNFWFGQGPWTPWQMAGWGLCGVLGAALALGARNAGRFSLAAVCGFAGILYGALLNFSLMATYGGDLSWRHFWLLEGRALPFEVAHVGGNVVLALVAGPAMVRMLSRFRERFEWRRGRAGTPGRGAPRGFGGALRGGGIAALLLLLTLAAFAPRAQASAAEEAQSIGGALHWLESQQRPNGGFAADSGRDAGVEMTSWAMLALAAAGRNPLDVTSGGKSPVDFLRSHRDEIEDAGDVARTTLALEAAGVDPRSFGGEDLLSRLLSQRRQNGSYQGWPATSAYAVLALRGAGAGGSTASTVAWLRKVQGKDGGWGNEPGDAATPEITGAVLQVLSPGSDASERALGYLRDAKRPNGGFAPGNNLSANAQATAWAIQGLLAAGKDPAGFGTGKSSLAYLRSLQASDGHFLEAPGQETSPVWVTSDVLVPLSGQFLPVAAPPRVPQPQASTPPTSAPPSSGQAPPQTTPSTGGSAASKSAIEALEDFGGPRGSPGGAAPPSSGGGAAGKPSAGSSGGQIPNGAAGSPLDETLPLPSSPSEATGEAASESTSSSSSSTAGSILLGLLAGCVLFALGLAVRKGWMRWRYGL